MRAQKTNAFLDIYYTCHQSGTAGLARVEGGPMMHLDTSELAEEREPLRRLGVAGLKFFLAWQ